MDGRGICLRHNRCWEYPKRHEEMSSSATLWRRGAIASSLQEPTRSEKEQQRFQTKLGGERRKGWETTLRCRRSRGSSTPRNKSRRASLILDLRVIRVRWLVIYILLDILLFFSFFTFLLLFFYFSSFFTFSSLFYSRNYELHFSIYAKKLKYNSRFSIPVVGMKLSSSIRCSENNTTKQ